MSGDHLWPGALLVGKHTKNCSGHRSLPLILEFFWRLSSMNFFSESVRNERRIMYPSSLILYFTLQMRMGTLSGVHFWHFWWKNDKDERKTFQHEPAKFMSCITSALLRGYLWWWVRITAFHFEMFYVHLCDFFIESVKNVRRIMYPSHL